MTRDIILLQQYARHRDAEAFRELTARYAGLVYGTCLRVLGNPADAEDVAQECFLELARKAGAIRTSLPGWLHALARSRAVDLARREATRRRYEQQLGGQPIAPSSWAELEPYIDAALAKLPDQLRQPILLHYLLGCTQAETAERLNTTQATVSRRLDKGIEALRAHLRKAGLIVPAALLATLFSPHAASAAPTTLTAALGKMAVSGGGETTTVAVGSGAILAAKIAASLVVAAVLTAGGLLIARWVAVLRHPTVVVQSSPAFTEAMRQVDVTTTVDRGVIDIGDIVAFEGQQKRFAVTIPASQIPAKYRKEFMLSGGMKYLSVDAVILDRRKRQYTLYGTFTVCDDVASGMDGSYATEVTSNLVIHNGIEKTEEFAKFAVHPLVPFKLASGGGDFTGRPIRIDGNPAIALEESRPVIAQVSPNLAAHVRPDGSGTWYLEVHRKAQMTEEAALLQIGFVALETPNKRYHNVISFYMKHAPYRYKGKGQWRLYREGTTVMLQSSSIRLDPPVRQIGDVSFTVNPPDIRITPKQINGNRCDVEMTITRPWHEHYRYFIIQQPTGATLLTAIVERIAP